MNKKAKLIGAVIVLVLGVVASVFGTWYLHHLLTRSVMAPIQFKSFIELIELNVNARNIFLLLLVGSFFMALVVLLNRTRVYQSELVTITPRIQIPRPAGQHQHGSAWFLAEKDKVKAFNTVEIDSHQADIKRLIEAGKLDKEIVDGVVQPKCRVVRIDKRFEKGGIVLGKKDKKGKERLYFIAEDAHTIVFGATRCGKTRHVVLQTIGLLGLTGESIIATDPKGECYIYTRFFLERCGYKVYALDFKNPKKSHRYNFCQPIIDAVNASDIPKAIDYTWDLVSILVGEAKGEKLWTNGEASIIAASLLAVVIENKKKPQYQNLTNVYYFIAEMCKPPKQGEEMAIVKYMNRLKIKDPTHPAVGLLAISEISPSRTRGSFFTSALTTLRLFTNPLIADMTCQSDFRPADAGMEKTAIFLILPDGKLTYHPIAALFCAQLYTLTTEEADLHHGGRLPIRMNFVLDEFGNFIKWPDLTTQLTAGGSRGIRFNFWVQGSSQLEEKYSKEEARTIKGNCENWIYLQTDDAETLKEISDKLGPYTTSSYSISSSQQKHQSASSSQSLNLISRPLLLGNEIGKIDRPYSLVTSRNDPAMMTAPDLSQWFFNDMYGLGDEIHNTKMIKQRQAQREERVIKDLDLWGIWNIYKVD
ncbi:VirD4-like conjugal transfer protein, CD1115 family [Acetobacterium woodii]|uniref:TRAG family protein n=1 Tax=Acetobacterium woodii (strain ATCC 29683 / DSM 1030 / JCM 2381 / KCTC 1655 / WB1) TaxID=931626 RepID=H6LDE2_ACEWD|nr:type IV secretory system conjugative DNA transfer family protein [Acetobacterium woodii]AFA47914.1 TRAG family protein [Acetobacterium woodii DSM 1030]